MERLSLHAALWVLFVSVWLSISLVWWIAARTSLASFQPQPEVLTNSAPTSTLPHLLIVSTSGGRGQSVECYTPRDTKLIGQVVTVQPDQVTATAQRLCQG